MEMMKDTLKRLGAITIALVLALCPVFSGAGSAYAASDEATSKEETAYVIMDADGNISSVSVSEWLRNNSGADSIRDISDLKDIENTSNDKDYTSNGNELIWKAEGSDIKYKGSTDSELPVDVYISYYMDGVKMSAEEIAGKSGTAQIVFSYHVRSTSSADGYTFSTPYTMVSGVLLDDERFSDISVTEGKVINDGNSSVCVGAAFPGMKSNLNISSDNMDIPETVEITAKTECFEIDGSYTIATAGILADLDLSGTDSVSDMIDEMSDAMDKLQDASDKLVDGASKLASGAEELDEKADTLNDGAGKLSDGASNLHSGADALAKGAASLAEGAKEAVAGTEALKEGTSQLKSGAEDLADGTEQLKTGSSELSTGLDGLYAGSTQLKSGVDSYVDGTDQIVEGISQVKVGADNVLTGETAVNQALAELSQNGQSLSTVSDEAIAAAKAFKELAPDKYSAYFDQLITYAESVKNYTSAIDQLYGQEAGLLDGIQSLDDSIGTLKEGGENLTSNSDALKNGAADIQTGSQQSAAGAKQLADGAGSVNDGVQQLKGGATAVDDGAQALSDGSKQISGGANAIKNGADSVTDGAKQVKSGAASLADGTARFKEGTSKLASGADELSEGISKFNKEGIEKLVSLMDDADIEDLFNRMKALANASGDPAFIGGISDNMSGDSKIRFKTGAVQAR